MKMKSVILLAVAGACGLVAMIGVQSAMSGEETEDDFSQILVATAEIGAGVPLDSSNTVFEKRKKSEVHEGYVTSAEEYENRALKVRAVPGEPIMKAKLGAEGEVGASIEIPKGMRVVTVGVDTTMSHSGLMLPGDRVDLLVTYKTRHPELGTVSRTKTILQYIKVFAADSIRDSANADVPEIKSKNISLLVTPDQAALVMLAKNKGNLHLALRPPTYDGEEEAVADVDESIFNDMEASFGERDKEPDEGGTDSSQGEENAQTFLQNQLANSQQAAEQKTVAPAPVEKLIPTWTIQVYEGDQLREEQVVLVDENSTDPPSNFQLKHPSELKGQLPKQRQALPTALATPDTGGTQEPTLTQEQQEELDDLKSVTDRFKVPGNLGGKPLPTN